MAAATVTQQRRGVEAFRRSSVLAGNILVRQLGTVIHPGENVGMGSDYTLFAKIDGTVKYETYVRKRKIQKRVHILPFRKLQPLNSLQKRRFFKARAVASFGLMRRPWWRGGCLSQR